MCAGATMIPELGFWHSAPESVHMAQCPNQGACMGDRLSLQACQTAAYAAPTLNGTTTQVKPAHLLQHHATCTEPLPYRVYVVFDGSVTRGAMFMPISRAEILFESLISMMER